MVTNLAEFKTKKVNRKVSTYDIHDISLNIEASLREDGTFNEHDWHVMGSENKIESLTLLMLTAKLLEKNLKEKLGEEKFKELYMKNWNKWFRKVEK
jgi:hypothetical protein